MSWTMMDLDCKEWETEIILFRVICCVICNSNTKLSSSDVALLGDQSLVTYVQMESALAVR